VASYEALVAVLAVVAGASPRQRSRRLVASYEALVAVLAVVAVVFCACLQRAPPPKRPPPAGAPPRAVSTPCSSELGDSNERELADASPSSTPSQSMVGRT
jgi:hypothetical protein